MTTTKTTKTKTTNKTRAIEDAIAQYNLFDIAMPKISEGAYSFLARYSFPPVAPDAVFEGWQNLYSLPPKNNDYVVYTILTNERRGTNISSLNLDTLPNEPGILTIEEMFEVSLQFDFCSADSLKALQRAAGIHTLCRDAAGVDFWKPYGVSMCYADGPQALPFVDEGSSWTARYMVTAHATYWLTARLAVEWFDNATVRLKPVKE